MLLRSIKLRNFRQFKSEQKINFSTDSHKNVTIIMGLNGSGKTSLAQAFTWCLYGSTDFLDPNVLNKHKGINLQLNKDEEVLVELELTHNNTEYTVTTNQIFKKDASGKIKANNIVRNIMHKKSGQSEFIKPVEVEMVIKKILPQDLSKYFFFDGERIDKMGKEIRKGKSSDFAKAVDGLVGLNAFIDAIDHLKPTSKYGVIGSYNESYDSSSNQKISEYTKDIDKYNEDLDKIDIRLSEIEKEEELARDKIAECENKINKYEDSEAVKRKEIELKNKVTKLKIAKRTSIESLLKSFHINANAYFSKVLIRNALKQLIDSENIDKGIPDIQARTIEHLINVRKSCICGNPIEFGNETYNALNKLLEFIPPQSIGTSIGMFIKESDIRSKSGSDLFEDINEKVVNIRECENDIDSTSTEREAIELKLLSMKDVTSFQTEIMKIEKHLRDLKHESSSLNQNKGINETSRDRKITERKEYTSLDERNRKIEGYKAYAQFIYDEIVKFYKDKATETRDRLEKNINEIFISIYNGGFSLTIDESYNIQIVSNEYKGYKTEIETSTAQSISVILAFIAGVIKIARENCQKSNDDNELLESEAYPLVMDAPLSSYDKTRIKSVCDVLPKIAEQIIIFIKDTDGEIAEENMNDKIGKRYIFDKINEFETNIIAR